MLSLIRLKFFTRILVISLLGALPISDTQAHDSIVWWFAVHLYLSLTMLLQKHDSLPWSNECILLLEMSKATQLIKNANPGCILVVDPQHTSFEVSGILDLSGLQFKWLNQAESHPEVQSESVEIRPRKTTEHQSAIRFKAQQSDKPLLIVIDQNTDFEHLDFDLTETDHIPALVYLRQADPQAMLITFDGGQVNVLHSTSDSGDDGDDPNWFWRLSSWLKRRLTPGWLERYQSKKSLRRYLERYASRHNKEPDIDQWH